MNEHEEQEYLANHYIHRSNWLRAGVLGANDGILSIASLAIGVAAASDDSSAVLLACIAGLVGGALSMAAGEFVSVSSQTDIEAADIERERLELETMPNIELRRLAEIYEERGLSKETALQVAKELTEHDALGAHIRDELGITEMSQAKPLQAAMVSGMAFISGGILPTLAVFILPDHNIEYFLYGSAIFFLVVLGMVTAKAGGSNMIKAVIRISLWGTIAMGLSAWVGYLFGVNV